jgi:hypothetical protein
VREDSRQYLCEKTAVSICIDLIQFVHWEAHSLCCNSACSHPTSVTHSLSLEFLARPTSKPNTDLAGNDLKSIHDLDVSTCTGLVHPVYCE